MTLTDSICEGKVEEPTTEPKKKTKQRIKKVFIAGRNRYCIKLCISTDSTQSALFSAYLGVY